MVDYAKMVVFANALKLKCRCAHIGTRSSLSFFSQPPFKLTLKERRKRVKVTKGDIRCLSAENSRQLSRAANHLLCYCKWVIEINTQRQRQRQTRAANTSKPSIVLLQMCYQNQTQTQTTNVCVNKSLT